MAKLSKEKTQHIILILLVTGIALSGVWFFLVTNYLQAMGETRKKQELAELKVKNAQDLALKSDAIYGELANAQKRLQLIEAEMANGDYFVWSLRLMESLMKTNNVKLLDSERPRENEVGAYMRFPYKAISFSVRASGYFHDIGAFLREFENQFPYLQCRNLSLTPEVSQTSSEREKLIVRFEVVALLQPNRS